jgi:hypothetical protein
MSWNNSSGQSIISHPSSSLPHFLESLPPHSLNLSTPSTPLHLDLLAWSLDMSPPSWANGIDYSWETVKVRRASRIVRHWVRNYRKSTGNEEQNKFHPLDKRRLEYRKASPTHNVDMLKLGYIEEDFIFPRMPAFSSCPSLRLLDFPPTN